MIILMYASQSVFLLSSMREAAFMQMKETYLYKYQGQVNFSHICTFINIRVRTRLWLGVVIYTLGVGACYTNEIDGRTRAHTYMHAHGQRAREMECAFITNLILTLICTCLNTYTCSRVSDICTGKDISVSCQGQIAVRISHTSQIRISHIIRTFINIREIIRARHIYT